MVLASARPQKVGVVSLVTRSANVSGRNVTPVSLEAVRPSVLLMPSRQAEGDGRRDGIDRDFEQEVVADVAGAVFDFQLEVVDAVGQVACRGDGRAEPASGTAGCASAA